MMWIMLMLLVGLILSGFFSGAETGFYRAARVRLLLDTLSGDRTARGLLWLTNNPSVFVATTLIGNNLANYLVSLAIVLAAHHLLGADGLWAEMIGPVLFSPLVFVYGELLPKNLFFHAPNQLLRKAGPPFLLFALLFAPLSAVLWSLARFIQKLIGQAPERVQLTLARKELQDVIEEGHEAGILEPAQRALAQQVVALANQPVTLFCTPPGRVTSVKVGMKRPEILRLARRHQVSAMPVMDRDGGKYLGYLLVVDLYLRDDDNQPLPIRPLIEIPWHHTHGAALLRMQTRKESLARVVDAKGATVSLLFMKRLIEPLFRAAAV